MRKIIMLFVVSFMCSCGNVGADSGTPALMPTYPHGHSNSLDGGALTAYIPITQLTGINFFTVYLQSTQTLATSGTWYKIAYTGEYYDTEPAFDTVTNYRHQPHISGVYAYSGKICGRGTTTITNISSAISKNSGIQTYTIFPNNDSFGAGVDSCVPIVTTYISMNGTTDYVEVYSKIIGTGTLTINSSYFAGVLVTH